MDGCVYMYYDAKPAKSKRVVHGGRKPHGVGMWGSGGQRRLLDPPLPG